MVTFNHDCGCEIEKQKHFSMARFIHASCFSAKFLFFCFKMGAWSGGALGGFAFDSF